MLLATSMAKKRGGPTPGQCLAWEKVPVENGEMGVGHISQDKALAQPLHFAASALPLFSPGCSYCLGDTTFLTFSKYQFQRLCQGKVCTCRSSERRGCTEERGSKGWQVLQVVEWRERRRREGDLEEKRGEHDEGHKELREGELEKLREGLQKRSPPFLLYLWSLNPAVLCGLSHVWSRVFSA